MRPSTQLQSSAWPLILAVLIVSMAACKDKKPIDQPSRTPPRTDFTPQEFGLGRKHTPDAACNREIDQLLEQIRQCYNTRATPECDALRRANSGMIARLKNSQRCSR